MLQLLQRLVGRAPRNELPPFDFTRNRFRVKKKWPPNLSELTDRQNFRFERKFKRRLRLKSIKPQWQKWTKIAQWSMISFVVVYGVLFHDFAHDSMNPRPGEQPFSGIRARMWGLWEGLWTHTSETSAGAPKGLPSNPRPLGGQAAAPPGERDGAGRERTG